jgi:acyl carrier protein
MKHALLAAVLVACASSVAPPCAAANPVPYQEIVDTVRRMAAAHMDRKPSEINTMQSLSSQGLSEKGLDSLVVDIQLEYGVVIPANELQQAKWKDDVAGLSVRRLAQMVERQMRSQWPSQ